MAQPFNDSADSFSQALSISDVEQGSLAFNVRYLDKLEGRKDSEGALRFRIRTGERFTARLDGSPPSVSSNEFLRKYFLSSGAKRGTSVTLTFPPGEEIVLSVGEVHGTVAPSDIQIRRRKTTVTASLNQILYGPPGTGKTYSSVLKAMSIIDGKTYTVDATDGAYKTLKKRFDELRDTGQICFVTFHQSYGYEDFIEGIRPTTEDGKVTYEVRDGVLKRIAKAATENWTKATPGSKPIDDVTFDAAFSRLAEQIQATADGSVEMQLAEGACIKVSLSENGAHLHFHAPSGNSWKISKQKLKSLWPRRNEIQKPSEISAFNRSYIWAALQALKRLEWNIPPTKAEPESLRQFVLVIDEINRGNISKVFGELITLVEEDKRLGAVGEMRVMLPYSQDDESPFGLPPNLHILGTMNTADRSIAVLDTALRRRFQFEELMPEPELLSTNVEGVNLVMLLETLNERIELLYDRDHTIGHAYFMGIASLEQLRQAFRHKVIPLLQEYFYENWSKVRRVLNDLESGDFVRKVVRPPLPSDGDDGYESEPRPVYSVNPVSFPVEAFKRIYGG
jgi:5-methylcytosine-specific restriction enzyme B